MKAIGQMMVIASAILAGASLDGWAQDWFGFWGLVGRLAFFTGTFLLGLWLEKKHYERKRTRVKHRKAVKSKRAKRMAVLKALKNNKSKAICHS